MLAGERQARRLFRFTTTPEERARLDGILETVHLAQLRHGLAGSLSHGQKQGLKIDMLLAQDPALLLVDEPVAGTTDAETEETARLLDEINRSHSVIVVEHDMEFVRALGVKVTCLHEGSVLAEGSIAHVSANPRVVEICSGAERCAPCPAWTSSTARRRR